MEVTFQLGEKITKISTETIEYQISTPHRLGAGGYESYLSGYFRVYVQGRPDLQQSS